MPLVTGKYVGSQNISKGGVNLTQNFAAMASAQQFFSLSLDTPGLPKLTWLVVHFTGGVPITLIPEIAVRRGDLVLGVAAYFFMPVSAGVLTVPGQPTVFEFNIPCQAMRLQLVTPAGAGAPNVSTVLMASG